MALFLVLIFSIESFGAVVSDNDGSAFITKAEFDSLKNDFQNQIDQYNTSIDSKIDGAIAAYLSGINLANTDDLLLDPNCHYSFPLVMFSQGEYWNDPLNSYYFNLSVPKYDSYATNFMADASNANIKYSESNPLNQPLILDQGDDKTGMQRFVRAGICNQEEEYPGNSGYLNVLSRDTSVTRNGNRGFELVNEGLGQFYKLYVSLPSAIRSFGGWGGTTYWYQYGRFYGLTSAQLTQTDGKLSWTGNQSSKRYWQDHEMVGWAYNLNLSNFNEMPLSSATNLNELITIWNNQIDTYGQTNFWNSGTGTLYTPKFESTVWTEMNVRKALYAKDSFMPGSLEGRWRYVPYYNADSSNMSVYVIPTPSAAQYIAAWNFTGGAPEVYWYQGTNFTIHPQWIADGDPTGTDDTRTNFSRIRAQQVFYYDSNGKRHFMDEGMYLGHYKEEGTVKFALRFTSSTNTNVRFALSKQPFGYDSVDSNRIGFKYNTSTINPGNYATVNPNQKLDVTVENINKDDELYLMWWPVTAANDCKLVEFSDYSITY